jgi:hypothetical protein
MVTRQCDNEEPTIRVYKYGLVPIGHLDERAIEELWRANKMWNKLVELHCQNRADWEKARCAANPQYLKITTDLATLNEKISKAYDDKRTARMNAGTRDTSHPLISAANDKIKTLKAKRSAIYEELKPIREKTDRDLNQKTVPAQPL